MKFLLDQGVYAKTASFLTEAGHDLVKISNLGLARASDESVLTTVRNQGQILITRDQGEVLSLLRRDRSRSE